MKKRISIARARSLVSAVLQKLGYNDEEASEIGQVIMYGALRESSQGLNKLFGWHMQKDAEAEMPIMMESAQTISRCNAMRNNGMYANSVAMNSLLKNADKYGLALVGVYNYNSSSGPLSYYTKQLAKQGFVALMFGSADPIGGIAPPRRGLGVFGTNPLSISIPYHDGDITLDMSTAKYTWGDLLKKDLKNESLERRFAFDDKGESTTDPKKTLNGTVSAFDGTYKGMGLAFMIQILAGALVGSQYAQSDEKCDYGNLIIGINPDKLGGRTFMETQIETMVAAYKDRGNDKTIFLPGEQGDKRYQNNLETDSVPISESLILKIEEFLRG